MFIIDDQFTLFMQSYTKLNKDHLCGIINYAHATYKWCSGFPYSGHSIHPSPVHMKGKQSRPQHYRLY